ncbi:hypothetical protein EDD21DRAFT_92820 [Dissophora ornata]|nr:hypothetical protein EDD21DRAFT_92820 [Dissophora ornata]
MTFYIVPSVALVHLQQAYIISNTDIRAKTLVDITDPDTYDVQIWDSVRPFFDVVVMTTEIFVNIMQCPAVNVDVQYLFVSDNCLNHMKKDHCFKPILGWFAPEPNRDRPAGSLDARIMTPSMDIALLMRQRHNNVAWIIPWEPEEISQQDTWAMCSSFLDDIIPELEDWNIDNDDEIQHDEVELDELSKVDSVFEIKATGAQLTFWSAISVLYVYCASLTAHNDTLSVPTFEIAESGPPTVWHCWLTLPVGAPILEFYSGGFSREILARRAAVFKACRELHSVGALDNRFLPVLNILTEQSKPDLALTPYPGLVISHPIPTPSSLGAQQKVSLSFSWKKRTWYTETEIEMDAEGAVPVGLNDFKKRFMNNPHVVAIGGAFLKFLSALDLYIRWPDWQEDSLTQFREFQLSDDRLKKITSRGLKQLVGQGFLSSGFDKALSAATLHLEPFQGIQEWSDFGKAYRTARSLATDPTTTVSVPENGEVEMVEAILGYVFEDRRLLMEALLHPRTNACYGEPSYDRLEFLGDAVLDVVAAHYWSLRYPRRSTELTIELKRRSVTNVTLGTLCVINGLHRHIRYHSPIVTKIIDDAEITLIRARQKSAHPDGEYWKDCKISKVLADIMESIFGAVYMDSGCNYEAVCALFMRMLEPTLRSHVDEGSRSTEWHFNGRYM